MAVVKLSSGYNIGVEKGCCSLLAPAPPRRHRTWAPVRQDPKLPELSIISTGGTIASRIDYRTGAVTSQFDADDILTAIPALAEIGRYRTNVLYTIPLREHDSCHLAGACPRHPRRDQARRHGRYRYPTARTRWPTARRR